MSGRGRENEHCNSKNVGYWEAEDGGMAMLPNEGQDGYTNKTSSCQTLVWPSIEFIQQAETWENWAIAVHGHSDIPTVKWPWYLTWTKVRKWRRNGDVPPKLGGMVIDQFWGNCAGSKCYVDCRVLEVENECWYGLEKEMKHWIWNSIEHGSGAQIHKLMGNKEIIRAMLGGPWGHSTTTFKSRLDLINTLIVGEWWIGFGGDRNVTHGNAGKEQPLRAEGRHTRQNQTP